MPTLHDSWLETISPWRDAITGWVIGPGLGRDKYMESFFPKLIRTINQEKKLLVLDADAIYYMCQFPELFGEIERGRVILTPNLRELGYLRKHLRI